MFDVIRYTPQYKEAWNLLVAESKNGTFLFDRNYMDYHSDRFTDHSLMVYRRGKLYALFPANVVGDRLISHGGLTYGGLITTSQATAADIVTVFRCINDILKFAGIRTVSYKPVPWIYHSQPSEEDLYAIFNACNAVLRHRCISSAICREHRNKWFRIRECGKKQAIADGIVIEREDNPDSFWHILTDNLEAKYNSKPVHSVGEIELLMQRFPDNIHLYVARKDGRVLGGTLLYITDNVVHSQYISANAEGKERHVLDLLFDKVICKSLETQRYFDFGISTERNGVYLNESLIYQKEGFGARGVCYDTYEWTL